MTYEQRLTKQDSRNDAPRAEHAAVVYCTDTGATRFAAQRIVRGLARLADGPFDFDRMDLADLLRYRALIVGVPTVQAGHLPFCWRNALERLDQGSMRGKLVAIFGVGDAHAYPASFVDSMGLLQHELSIRGARFVGDWPVEGYRMIRSAAVVDGRFVGLALDDGGEPAANQARIRAWTSQIRLPFEDHLDARGVAGLAGVSGVAA
jgi:flavodoxin I